MSLRRVFPEQLRIYTDGAYKNGVLGWAYVVTGSNLATLREDWGAVERDSYGWSSGELLSVYYAMRWLAHLQIAREYFGFVPVYNDQKGLVTIINNFSDKSEHYRRSARRRIHYKALQRVVDYAKFANAEVRLLESKDILSYRRADFLSSRARTKIGKRKMFGDNQKVLPSEYLPENTGELDTTIMEGS